MSIFKINKIFGMCLSILFVSCTNHNEARNSPPPILGIWSVIENDSVYYEMFFTKSKYWIFSDKFGDARGTYTIEGDSLELQNRYNIPFLRSRMRWIGDDEFHTDEKYLDPDLANQKYQARQYRLNVNIDTAAILRNDTTAVNNFLDGSFNRFMKFRRRKID